MKGITKINLPERSMSRNAFGANGASVVSSSLIPARAGRPKPSMRPPPSAAVAVRKLRREQETSSACINWLFILCLRRGGGGVAQVCSRYAGRSLDRGANARVGAAAADVACHRIVDVRVARLRIIGDQRACRHDLA